MLALALILALSLPAFPSTENLLDNPDFELGREHWHSAFGTTVTTDREVVHSGTFAMRLQVDGQTCGLDNDPLIPGPDIDPSSTYRVSAWVRSGGVQRGEFGGRLYCHAVDGKVLAMHSFGVLQAGAKAGDWQQSSLTVGPDGECRIPEGTGRVVVRFSIWAEDGDCAATVWVDDVAFERLAPPLGTRPRWLAHSDVGSVVILRDDLPATGTASDPERIAQVLSDRGFATTLATSEQLAQPGALDPEWVDLVILPYGGSFPAVARDAFMRYVRTGGSFLSLGGLPFEHLMYRVDGEWVAAGVATPNTEAPAAVVADFEATSPEWDLSHAGEGEKVIPSMVEPGADGSPRGGALSFPDLAGFAYGGIAQGAGAPDAATSLLCFWARGDATTTQVAVEVQESDRSRWKKVVRLTDGWQQFCIPASTFLPYATKDRGGPGDSLAPERVDRIYFGLTRGMVGGGSHTVCIDQVTWCRPKREPLPPVAPMRSAAEVDPTIMAFGSDTAAPVAEWALPIFTPTVRVQKAASLRADEDGWLAGAAPIETELSGYEVRVPTALPPDDPKGLSIGGRRAGRYVSLLSAYDAAGTRLGSIAGVFLPAGKAQRRAVWACSGVDSADLLQLLGPAAGDLLGRIAAVAAGAPRLSELDVDFSADERDGTRLVVVGSARGREGVAATYHISLDAGKMSDTLEDYETKLPNRFHLALLHDGVTVPYAFRIALESRALADRVEVTVDPKATFLRLADWLVANQKPDGTFSGISFEDNRAARGLLGAFEITGDAKYRDAAIRWGREMLRLQREDGGYRMGYGITKKGEECYVADGGEIAIAMARLTGYTEGAERQRFVDSLKAYMGYRESFREQNGAIGVGWCLQDYSKRPIVPLETPTRIYAGEQNTYTIGCTLAAACAYAKITGRPEDMQMALRDTEWLLAHYKSLSGAAMESAIWAHHYIADADLSRRIEDHLRESFYPRITNPEDRGWLKGGGRSVLDLDGIAYWLKNVDQTAAMRAAHGRWLYALCGSDSTSRIEDLLDGRHLKGDDKRFLCFAAVALADAVQPMVSMRDF